MMQSEWKLKEHNLFDPLRKWIKSNNPETKVFTEVYGCDVMSYDGKKYIGYELKMSCNKTVIRQAYTKNALFNESYIVVPTNPKQASIDTCKKYHLGLLQIKGTEIKELLKSEFNNFCYIERQKIDLSKWEEGAISGRPNMKGEGPAQTLLIEIKKYLESHPNAKWKEIFLNVHNHYRSYTSMQNSMRMWQNFTL